MDSRRSPGRGLAHAASDAKIPALTTRVHVDWCVRRSVLVTSCVMSRALPPGATHDPILVSDVETCHRTR
jgi:hypothetical protein